MLLLLLLLVSVAGCCPPWQVASSPGACHLPNNHPDILSCQDNRTCVQLDYCLSYNPESLSSLAFYCPYNTLPSHHLTPDRRSIVVNTSTASLSNFTCSPLSREGVYCQSCYHGYGPSVFTQDLSCYDCSQWFSGWALYLALEYLPLTLFLLVVILSGISPTSGYLNCFVLLSQLVSLVFSYGGQAQFVPPFGETYDVLISFLRTVYGFWNLDFFRGVFPGFCVSAGLSNLAAVSLLLAPPTWPIALVIIGWLLVWLHQHNCPPLVVLWKPFRRCLSHFPLPNNLRQYILGVLANFYILGYCKLLHTATLLLVRGKLYSLTNSTVSNNNVLLVSPDVQYFSSRHGPYIALSLSVLLAVILAPMMFLLVFPAVEKWVNSRGLKTTAALFSEPFRRESRHWAGVYLLVRVVVVLLFSVIWSPVATYITLCLVFAITAISVAVCRPYKSWVHNALDTSQFSLLSLAILCAVLSTNTNPSRDLQTVLSVALLICLLAPLAYASLYIIYRVFKMLYKCFRAYWTRRGYQQVLPYEEESTAQ